MMCQLNHDKITNKSKGKVIPTITHKSTRMVQRLIMDYDGTKLSTSRKNYGDKSYETR